MADRHDSQVICCGCCIGIGGGGIPGVYPIGFGDIGYLGYSPCIGLLPLGTRDGAKADNGDSRFFERA